MHNQGHVLQAYSVTKQFVQGNNVVTVLNGVSYAFEQAKAYAIRGVSGSGKSTLLHLLGGLDAPTSGAVLFDNQNVATLRDKTTWLNKKIGFVFQFHYLIKELTVCENIMIPGMIGGVSLNTAKTRAIELLERVGLSHRADVLPMKLSGGELQRAAIARALFNKPAFLIADEPTASLDRDNADTIMQLLLAMQQEWHMGLIICTHDQAIYRQLPHVVHIQEGRLFIENT